MSLLAGMPVSADVVAAEPSVLYGVSPSEFDALMRRKPELVEYLAGELAVRLKLTNARLAAQQQRQAVLSSLIGARRGAGFTDALPSFGKQLQAAVAAARDSDLPLLLVGEKGVGKKALALHLHATGPRRAKPVIVVDCRELPREGARSLLFGQASPESVSRFADHLGYVQAADRRAAAVANKPDVMILDVMMPEGTEGFHLVWKLRQMEDPAVREVPIIMATGIHATTKLRFYPEQSDGTYQPSKFLPVQDWIDKPVKVEELARVVRGLPLQIHSVHCAFSQPSEEAWDISHPEEKTRVAALDRRATVVRASVQLGAQHVVMHPGGRPRSEARLAHCRDGLAHLAEVARAAGMKIAVENPPPDHLAGSLAEMERLLDGLDPAVLGFCLDTGHATLGQDSLDDYLRVFGDRLIGIHWHENDAGEDAHLFPEVDDGRWDGFLAALDAVGYDLPITLEAAPPSYQLTAGGVAASPRGPARTARFAAAGLLSLARVGGA